MATIHSDHEKGKMICCMWLFYYIILFFYCYSLSKNLFINVLIKKIKKFWAFSIDLDHENRSKYMVYHYFIAKFCFRLLLLSEKFLL